MLSSLISKIHFIQYLQQLPKKSGLSDFVKKHSSEVPGHRMDLSSSLSSIGETQAFEYKEQKRQDAKTRLAEVMWARTSGEACVKRYLSMKTKILECLLNVFAENNKSN